MQSQNKRAMLTTMPLGKLLAKQSLPAMAGMFAVASYNIVDALFVGWGVGPLAIAATAAVFPLQFFISALCMLSAIGTASRSSIALGAGNDSEAEKILANGFVLSICIGVLITVVGFLSMDFLFQFLGGNSPELKPLMKEYFSIVLIASPLNTVAVLFNNAIRAEGNMRYAMISMIIPAFSNTFFDWLFIFVFHWGIAGAAWATALGQLLMFLWNLRYYLSPTNKRLINLRLSQMKPRLHILKNIASVGVTESTRQIAVAFASAVSTNQIAIYGTPIMLAAAGIVFRLNSFIMMPIFGIGQGLQPILGYCYGAKLYERTYKAAKLGIICASVFSTAMTILSLIFAPQMINLFTNDATVISLGGPILRTVQSCVFLIGMQIIGTVIFQALGFSKPALFLSMSRQILFLIPLMLILPRFFGTQGIFITYPICDVAASTLTFTILMIYRKKILAQHYQANETVR